MRLNTVSATRLTGGLLMMACVVLPPSHAQAATLVQHRPFSPISAGFGLPEVAARIDSEQRIDVSFEHYNIFNGGTAGSESLLLDGESSRLDVRFHKRFGNCWSGMLTGAWIAHSGGVFDGVIDDWHQWFGLPNAGRESAEDSALHFFYLDGSDRDADRPRIDAAASGPGDVRLAVQRTVDCSRQSVLFRAGLKLPLGDEEKFFGSGTTDLFVDLQTPSWTFARRWSTAAAIGMLRSGDTDNYARQRSLAGYGTLAAEFGWQPRRAIFVQFDWHTPLFDSELRELGTTAGILSAGLRFDRATHRFIIGVAEDLLIDTAPDIVLHIEWQRKPGR